MEERTTTFMQRPNYEEAVQRIDDRVSDMIVEYLNKHPHELENVVIAGIDMRDYGDFCDAYIESAEWMGIELPVDIVEQLDVPEFVNAKAHDQAF